MRSDTFYVQVYYNGGMNSFEIVPEEGQRYNVFFDGKIIAQIFHNEEWRQVWGDTLPADAFISIVQELEGRQSH
jgi:hypothetical protein